MACIASLLGYPQRTIAPMSRRKGGVPFSARQKAQAGLLRNVSMGQRTGEVKSAERGRGPDGDHLWGRWGVYSL